MPEIQRRRFLIHKLPRVSIPNSLRMLWRDRRRLLPALLAVIRTDKERLHRYRRTILILVFAERNHVCSVCVANGKCEFQDLAIAAGMGHVEFHHPSPDCEVDVSHARFGVSHNRCILCMRCVRTCANIEGAQTWDVAGRGFLARVIIDMNQPWGEATTCTSSGKCVMACPTGALFHQGDTIAKLDHDRSRLTALIAARRREHG